MTDLGTMMVSLLHTPGRSAFAKAWLELMPGDSLDFSLTWSEAGVDSLKRLRLVLQLEETLQRPVPFDHLTRDATIGEFLEALECERRDGAFEADLDAPTLYLLPGVFGDEPILAEFRASLSPEVRTQTLSLPDVDGPCAVASSMEATATFVCDQIVARGGEGDVHLGGYSFGSLVAIDVARRLIAQGRVIGSVILLDPPVGRRPGDAAEGDHEVAPAGLLNQTRSRTGRLLSDGGLKAFERVAYWAAVGLGAYEAARWLLHRFQGFYGFERNHLRRRRLLYALRGEAMRRWRPAEIKAPVLLVTSDDYGVGDEAERWSGLCPQLTRLHVGAGHLQLFEPTSLARLRPAVLQLFGLSAGAPEDGEPSRFSAKVRQA